MARISDGCIHPWPRIDGATCSFALPVRPAERPFHSRQKGCSLFRKESNLFFSSSPPLFHRIVTPLRQAASTGQRVVSLEQSYRKSESRRVQTCTCLRV